MAVAVSPSSTTYRRLEILRPGIPALVTAEVGGRRPGHEWALIAPRAVGVCRSDLKELMGVRQGRRDFGHEIIADVVDCAGAAGLAPGDVVTLDPHVPLTRTTGFAELVECHGQPGSLERALLRLTATLAYGPGLFVEPLACAAGCVRRIGQAVALLGERRGPAAVVGAGIFGVLIAALLRAVGRDVFLLNRTRGRLDFLDQREVFPSSRLLTLDQARGRRFAGIVLATTFAEPELVTWCAEHAVESALITVFGGTYGGMTTGDEGVDLDGLRRRGELREVRVGGRPFWLAGYHGAEHQDFDRAMAVLETEAGVRHAVARLRGPELSLPEAVHALPEYARRSIFGKPVVRLPAPDHATA